jgi:hypothetical protein
MFGEEKEFLFCFKNSDAFNCEGKCGIENFFEQRMMYLSIKGRGLFFFFNPRNYNALTFPLTRRRGPLLEESVEEGGVRGFSSGT